MMKMSCRFCNGVKKVSKLNNMKNNLIISRKLQQHSLAILLLFYSSQSFHLTITSPGCLRFWWQRDSFFGVS